MFFIFTSSLCVYLSSTTATSYSDWQVLSTKIPTDNGVGGAAIAYGNEEIWILGGSSPQQSLLSYNINTKTFSNHGDSWLQYNVYGRGQFYTQIDSILYMINGVDTQSFIQFNTEQKTAIYNYESIPLPVEYAACLASSGAYLFILGQGFGAEVSLTNKAQILNTQTNEWLSNVPDMLSSRSQSACTVNENYLYVMGGSGELGSDGAITYHNTVEILNINDLNALSTESWAALQNTLSHKLFGPRAVNHGTDILVIGGTDIPSWEFITDINVIDVTTNGISVEDGPGVGFGVSVASISVDNVLYAFNYRANEIWYLDLPTITTAKPSSSTTKTSPSPSSSATTTNKSSSSKAAFNIMDYWRYIAIGAAAVLVIIICICCIKKIKKKGRKTVKLKKPKKIKNYQQKSTIKVASVWEINENADDPLHKEQILAGYNKQTSAINDISMRELAMQPSTQKISSVFDESASDESSDENLAVRPDDERLTVNIKEAKHTNVSGLNERELNKYK